MSFETVTFRDELKKLDKREEEFKTSYEKLIAFILSIVFLKETKEFKKLLSELEGKLVTLAEAIEKPFAGLPQTPLQFPGAEEPMEAEENPLEDKSFSWPKALVMIFIVISSAVIVQQHLLPIEAFIGVLIVSFFLLFFSSIKSLVQMVFAEKEKKEEMSNSMRLEEWVNESFSKIRRLYTSARFLMMFQNASKETLPNYGLPGMPEELYSREKYFSETLPDEFLSRIGRVVEACDKNLYARRQLLVHAITAAQASANQPGAAKQ